MSSIELLLDISNNDMNDIIKEYTNDYENKISKTDREIFYYDLFQNSEYINSVESFVIADEYIEYLNFFLSNNENNGGKINEKTINKKILEYQSVITDFSNLSTVSVKKYKNQFIVNRNSISVPFTVRAIVDNKEYLIPKNTNFAFKSFKNRTLFSLDHSNKFREEINKNLINVDSYNKSPRNLISKIANYMNNIDINNKINSLYDLNDKRSNPTLEYSGEYNKNLLDKLNSFLYSKLFNTNISTLYNSFDIDSKLHVLEKLYIKGENDLSVMNTIKSLLMNKIDEDKYNKNILNLLKKQSELSNLEFMCKNKFPNLFNKNSKELLFNERNIFSLDKMPAKYKSILLSEYSLRKSYEKKILESNCGHKLAIEKLKSNSSYVTEETWKNVLQWIEPKEDKSNNFHNCVSCGLPALCSHDYFLYSNYGKKDINYDINKLSKVMEHTVNKFMASGGSKGFMYCKNCGQELSNIKEEESSIGYEDSKNMYNKSILQDSLDADPLNRLVYYTISRNMSIGATYSANSIISNVITNITNTIKPIVSILNKKNKSINRKKNIQEQVMDKNTELNIIIMVIVSIMILSIKFKFITFKSLNNKNGKQIIIPKNDKDMVKFKFKEAFDIFYYNYTNLIKETNYVDKLDILKELFVKIYMLIKDTLSESISISEDNIKNFTDDSIANIYSSNDLYIYYNDKKQQKYNYSIPVVNYIYKNTLDIYGSRQQPSNTNLWIQYKNDSLISFKNFINNNLYETYNAKRDEEEWLKYNEDNLNILNIENELKELNIKQTLYPYSHIPYSYARYFKENEWGNDMGLYACSNTGRRHIWTSYVFSLDGKDEEIEIVINKTGDHLEKIKNSKLKSIRCKNCNLTTDKLIKKEYSEKDIFKKVVESGNDINSFYIVYRYRCLINKESNKDSFHEFLPTKINNDHACKKCGILFKQLMNKNVEFYTKNLDIYQKYIDEINIVKNKELLLIKEASDNILSLDYEKINTQNISDGRTKKIMLKSNKDKLLELEINKFSILSKTGETENVLEKDIEDMEIDSGIHKNDIFLKIIDRIKEVCIAIGIVFNNPIKHKYIKNAEFVDMLNDSIRVDTGGNITKLYKEYILTNNFIKLCWEYRNIKGLEEGISFSKSCLYDILINVKEHSETLYNYINKKITEIDILYTAYDYGEIKKIFNVSKIVEDSIENSNFDVEEEYNNDSELFDSSDLSMNNFEDDDLDNDV